MESDNDEYSADQMDKIVHFQEITGNEDVSSARRELSEHGWNVESAIQNYLTRKDNLPHDNMEVINPSIRDSDSHSDTEGESSRITPVRRQMSISRVIFWPLKVLFNWGFFFFSLPLRIFSASLLTIYRFIVPDPLRLNPLGDIVSFIKDYELQYGVIHPSFFQGSYSQALNHAKSELKFLLVYLHSWDHQDTPLFCQNTLSDSSVIEFINSTMIFWSCSVSTGEGYKVSQALRENGYPFLAIIVLRENRMTVVGRLEGPINATQLVDHLRAIISDNEAYLVMARADRQEREMTAALRQEQDVAYLESLRVDQEKARKRMEEEEALIKQVLAEKEKEMKVIEERENRRRLKIEWADRIPKEPDDYDEKVIHIVAKLPQGSRLERRFNLTDSLEGLYYYIFCHPDSPDRFQVTTNFPRKVVPCEPSSDSTTPSFQEFGLEKQSLLFVIDLDA